MERAAAKIHHRFLWLLVGCYLLAAYMPGPGEMLRHWTFIQPSGREVHAPMLLLALLLFCAAATIQWSQIHELLDRPGALALGLLTAWLGPAVLVLGLGMVLSHWTSGETVAGVMVGLALVAAMPVANSSVGWSQNAGGSVALGLALIVLSILLSPLATPQMLSLMGFALSAEDTQHINQVVTQFSGWKFIVWVILPSLAGAIAAWIAGPERIARAKTWIRLVTLVDLLLLNYTNASLAMPEICENETLATVGLYALLALSIPLLGLLLAIVVARFCQAPPATGTALLFGLSMKHTGLALVLAGEVLAQQPRVLLMIMLSTLLQHVVAGVADKMLQRKQSGPMG